MKMILIITNKDDITVDYLIRDFRRNNIEYYRFNTEEIFSNIDLSIDISSGKCHLFDKGKNMPIDLNDVESVYYRRPGIPKLEEVDDVSEQEKSYLIRESLSILDGLYKLLENRYWINNVYRIREAENKIFQLSIAKEIGFDIPDTVLSNVYIDIIEFSDSYEECIIKPVRSGNLNPLVADKIIFTNVLDKNSIKEENISTFPVYIQNRIKKKLDIRCITVGTDVFAVEILSQQDDSAKVDWRKSEKYIEHRIHKLPCIIKRKCIEITNRLGLVYSAIDLVLDENGNYIFLECNPNGQWAWLEMRLGIPIAKTIEEMLVKNGKTIEINS